MSHTAFEVATVVEKLKVKVESLEPYGESKLVVGGADGTILVFDVQPSSAVDDPFVVNLVGNKKFAKKAVSQVNVLEDERVIVALADGYVHVLNAGLEGNATRLDATKGASIYAVDTSGPVALLAVGVRKKLVLYRWSGPLGTFQAWKELAIPDVARALVWRGDSICIGFRREYTLIHVTSGAMMELCPAGGDPSCILLPDDEMLLSKDHLSIFVGLDGKPSSRKAALTWSELPIAVQYTFPYVLGLLSKAIEVRSLHTQNQVQLIALPKPRRIAAKGSVVYVSSSTSIYRLQPIPLLVQINELVDMKEYEEAICLTEVAPELETINRQERLMFIKLLYAYSLFFKGSYDDAMHLFFQLKANPAQIISMFPDLLPMELRRNFKYPFKVPDLKGAELNAALEALIKYLPQVRQALIRQSTSRTAAAVLVKSARESGSDEALAAALEAQAKVLAGASSAVSTGGASASDEAGPSSGAGPSSLIAGRGAGESRLEVGEDDIRLLGSVGGSTILFIDPENPSSVLTVFHDSKGLRQIVDTSLLKAYLRVKPSLAKSLLRIDNACHVEACEEVLIKAAKFEEVVLLYRSKGLHRQALELLRKLAKNHTDGPMAGPEPTVKYLRTLGAEDFELVSEFSIWVLESHPSAGLSIFTADNEAVRSLPIDAVRKHIAAHAKSQVEAYLEHVVFERGADVPSIHNELAFIYLAAVAAALKASPRRAGSGPVRVAHDRGVLGAARAKLLNFLRTSRSYEASRILSKLAPLKLAETELYEERAVLLAGIGSHEEALIIYAYGLGDQELAVEHCARYYDAGVEANRDVYLTLLSVFMAPPAGIEPLQEAAMELLNAYSDRIDIPRALDLLPAHTSLASLLPFFEAVLKANSQEYRSKLILRNVLKSENLLVRDRMTHERSRYFVIEDNQMCPVCHKRILASHSLAAYPNNVVVHYRCASKEKDVCPVTGVRFHAS